MSKQGAGYTVWRWLKAQGCDQAAKEIEEKLGITHDLETLAGSLVPRELEDFLANQPTLSERLAVAAKDDKFVEFEASVTAKGFYKDAEEGTLEHLERRSKLLQKYMERTGVSLGEPATSAAGNAKAEEEAEDKKSLGNAAMTGKDYDLAVQFYTEAIALSSTGPNSHVYYSNRAAAYCSQSRYANAISDCEAALKLVPDYSKAAARLGLANFYTENYEAAIAAYERAVAIEPDNKSHSDALAKAKGKLAKKQSGLPVGRSAPSSSSSSSSAAAPKYGRPHGWYGWYGRHGSRWTWLAPQ